MDKKQRQIILKWLKQGFIDWYELKLLQDDDDFIESLNGMTEEEAQKAIEMEEKRLLKASYGEYCALMKICGMCVCHNNDN